jgi:hypothetical protein
MKVEVEADGTLLLKEVVKGWISRVKKRTVFVEDGQWRIRVLLSRRNLSSQWKDDKKSDRRERNEMLE